MFLIIGLGNPGKEYEYTRHNIGFRVVDAFATKYHFGKWQKKFSAEITEGVFDGKKIILMKPQTFMNNSGDAVIQAAQFWKITPEQTVIVSDDIDLDLGVLRIRPSGSAGGHNGIVSIIQRLGTSEIPRLRIGIGKNHDVENDHRIPAEEYVLQKFSDAEETVMTDTVSRSLEALTMIVTQGTAAAMNTFN